MFPRIFHIAFVEGSTSDLLGICSGNTTDIKGPTDHLNVVWDVVKCFQHPINHILATGWRRLNMFFIYHFWHILHPTFSYDSLEYTEVYNFADDTTFRACHKDLTSFINRLEHNSLLAIEWFENNNMKLNQDKCHLIVPRHKHENVFAFLVSRLFRRLKIRYYSALP